MKILHYSALETPYHGHIVGGSLKISHQLYEATIACGHECQKLSMFSLPQSGMTLQEYKEYNKFDLLIINADDICEFNNIMNGLKPPFIFFQHCSDLGYYPPIILNDQVIKLAPSKNISNKIGRNFIPFPPGVDISEFCPKPSRNNSNEIVVGFMARLADNKINQNAISALKKYPIVKIGGGGDFLEFCRNCNFDCTGAIGYSDVPVFLNQLDIFAYPTKQDSFGLVLLEAQASGIPVVTFDVGGVRDTFIPGESGFLVNTIEEFIDKIDLLYNDNELRKQMGLSARKYAECFSLENLPTRIQTIINGMEL